MSKKPREILSYSGVITNSSTEVFNYYSPDSLDSIKEVVNNFFKLCKNPYTFDDIFKFKINLNLDYIDEKGNIDKERLEDEIKEYIATTGDTYINKNNEKFLNFLLNKDGSRGENEYEFPLIGSIEVICTDLGKSLGYEDISRHFTKLIPTESREIYC